MAEAVFSSRFKREVRIKGGSRVVNMTMRTTMENNSLDITPSSMPMVANISPTSPRGTIPIPTKSLLELLSATIPQTNLLRMATAVKIDEEAKAELEELQAELTSSSA